MGSSQIFSARCRPALCSILGLWLALCPDSRAADPQLRAGAYVQDITPPFDSLLINGGFLEKRRGKMKPGDLNARCFVLQGGEMSIAIAVVDSCMIPRDLCDRAKALASKVTGIPTERILIAATHTHSAPSTMDFCLGTMADPAYTEFLPPKIAEGIKRAHDLLQPARIGWNQVSGKGYTYCRRWITRPDKMMKDPFGDTTVRAMMHPGFQNPNFIGPSGPEDEALSVLSIQTLQGRPLGVLANFSMHYHGGGGPADYFGLFSDRLAQKVADGELAPVCAMTQGTSGDTHLRDYSGPRKNSEISAYTNGLVKIAAEALEHIQYDEHPLLGMDERDLTLSRRLPDAERLAWADDLLGKMEGRRPKNRPEVYAEQARYIHENPTEKLVLQTLRIGGLGITAMPNEVYAITGLKLKARSPFSSTFNIELANGAAGYIPPPAQHALGGYTTWPARTAGLEVGAEPKIVEALLASLESLAGGPRREPSLQHGAYAKAMLAEEPLAYWRCEEFEGDQLADASGNVRPGRIEGTVAYHLPGPDHVSFSGDSTNRSLQLAGGTVSAAVAEARSLSFWFWNGMDSAVRDNTGDLVQQGESFRLRIGGVADAESSGHLILQSGDRSFQGSSELVLRHWHHVLVSRDGSDINVYLDGSPKPEIRAALPGIPSGLWRFGGELPFEGRIDEVAWFKEALSAADAERLYAVSGIGSPPKPQPPGSKLEREPEPVAPTDSFKAIHVPKGFKVQLVAAEPLVKDPVAIDWDPDGKLWVAEMADYPDGINGEAGGRVRFLEDADGDGVYDKSSLFLEGVNFPAGIMSWGQGVLVAAAPDIFYAEDSDGDGVADVRTVLYTGFKQGNQQLRVNGLRWGLDNWVHGANGSHHARYAAGTKITSPGSGGVFELGGLDFRIRPDEGLLEPLSGPSQFGRTRDDWGNWFGVQNSFPLWHYVLKHRYLARNPDFAPPDPRRQLRPQNALVFAAAPPQKRFHSFNQSGRFTSACSPVVYRDSLLFAGDATHAFTCEPFHNLVQHVILKRDGCSFTAARAEADGALDFFASEDRWCRPVMARTGPDGALWVVDMYRYMIEHPEWLPAEGKTEMKPYERLGSEHGRIYRVYPEKRAPRAIVRLDKASGDELVAKLADENGIVRDLAHRLLVEGKAVFVPTKLAEMAKTHDSALARLHALCVLDGIDRLGPELVRSSLRDPHPQVRRHAVRLAESRWDQQPDLLADVARLADDPDAAVRLQLACSLGQSASAEAGRALAELMLRDAGDSYIRAAVFSSAGNHFDQLVNASVERGVLVAELVKLGGGQSKASLDALVSGLAEPGKKGFAPGQFLALGAWLDQSPKSSSRLSEAIDKARGILVDSEAAVPLRAAAASLLGRQPATLADDHERLAKLLAPQVPSEIKQSAVAALARIGGAEFPSVLLAGWTGYFPNERAQILDTLLQRKEWTRTLLDAIRRGAVARGDLDASRRQLLLTHADAKIRKDAEVALGAGARGERQQRIDARRAALKLEGDEKRGRVVFQNLCAVCHLPPEGLPMNGPDLRSITDRSKDGLFSSIVDPNQAVDPSYSGYSVTLTDGTSLYGRVLSETSNNLTLRLLDGSDRQLLRREVKDLKNSGLSLMPEGLEAALSQQDLADLIRFVQTFKRDEP